MKIDDDSDGFGTPGEAFWQKHYEGVTAKTNGRPSAALVRFAKGRASGRSLDLGCARGDDVIWLARQGWTALGVDVADAALSAARDAARSANVSDRATFEQHDLSVSFPEGEFDLVTALFFHSPVELPREKILRKAASVLKPGGLLLSVTHASVAPWSWADPNTEFPTAEEELAAIGLDLSLWRPIEVDSPDRVATGPGGQTASVTDNIIAVERL